MLTEARFLSVKEARKLPASSDTVIVSILDQFEEWHRPEHLAEFKDALVLHFVDTFEKPGEPAWPDQMDEAQHRSICTWDEDRAPELTDAQQLVAFILKHHSSADLTKFVVHCHGGVSRSAAVAKWVASAHGVPLPQLGDGVHSIDKANPRVIRLMNKAAGRTNQYPPR